MIRPVESDYTSAIAYTRALEYYCDRLEERKWVGLTKAELDKIISPGPFTGLIKTVVSTVESRLREKNT
jgi:hypothetical protein